MDKCLLFSPSLLLLGIHSHLRHFSKTLLIVFTVQIFGYPNKLFNNFLLVVFYIETSWTMTAISLNNAQLFTSHAPVMLMGDMILTQVQFYAMIDCLI